MSDTRKKGVPNAGAENPSDSVTESDPPDPKDSEVAEPDSAGTVGKSAFVRRCRAFADSVRKKRAFAFSAAALFVLAAGAGGYFGFRQYESYVAVPQVLGANFSLEYRKIPFDAPSVDFTLSIPLDPSTVSAATVTVSPGVPGSVSVKDGNVVSYALSEKLEIGSRYAFTLSKDIASRAGTKLGRDYVVELEAVSGVMVARAIPTGETSELAKDPVFIFNVPVVPLGALSSTDRLPCPVKFEPAVPGRCRWIAGNVLEYDLEKPLRGSTKYAVSVSDSPAFLYPLKAEFRTEFSTPVLSAFADTGSVAAFSPASGIPLRFSAPVAAEALAGKLSVVNEANGQAVPAIARIADGTAASEIFEITGKDGPFDHSASYRVTVAAGLVPAEGNLPMPAPVEFRARANDFITDVAVKFPQFSDTGALVDTVAVWSEGPVPVIPSKNAILVVQFDEKVDFANAKVRVETVDGSVRRECKISTFETDAWADGVPTKRQALKCELSADPLPAGTAVRLVLPKEASRSLRTDATKDFFAAPKFEVSGFKLLSPTEACFASTTPVLNSPEYFAVSPSASVREISEDAEWGVNANGESVRTFKCPQVPGKKTYVASVRLNPRTEYSFRLRKGTPDGYGNVLESDADFGKTVTGDVSEKDKYLYSSATRPINVLPADAKLVLGLQSVNVDSATVEVCETDAAEYFLLWSKAYYPGYQPKCRSSKKISVPLENRHWKLSPKQLDVESEVLGKPLSSPFVVLRGSVKDSFNLGADGSRDDNREFLNFFVRSSIALDYERAGQGKSYLFATTFDGKTVLSDLRFEAYDANPDGLVPANAKFVWNPKKSAYEVTGSFRYLLARNASGVGVVSTDSDQANNYDFGYVSGQDTATKDYAYVYGDRPIYRAGDTVHFKILLRRFHPEGYKVSPIKSLKVRVVDQDGNAYRETVLKTDANSHAVGSFELAKGMRTGRYDFVISDAAAKPGDETLPIYEDGHFFVEQYVKPTFRVSAPESSPDALPQESVASDLEATYYFGGAVAGAPYVSRIFSQNYYFDPKEYSEYRFGTADSNYDCVYWGYCDASDSFVETLSGRLDGNGRTRLAFRMPDLATSDMERIYSFHTDVTDPDTGKTINATVSKILHRTDANVGIRAPYWVSKSDPIRIDGVVLDHSAKALAGKAAKVEFVRREWKEVKKLGIDGTYYSENEIVETPERSQSVTTDSEGRYRAEYLPAKGGEFEIRATYAGRNGKESIASAYAYVATDDYVSWGGTNNSVTQLTAEKTVVKPGAKAVFTLKSPVSNGKAFVVVEKDDAILDAFTIDIRSFAERIEIPLDARHIPNVYVKAYLIGKSPESPLPTYKRALSVVKVVPDEKRLSVTVTADNPRKNPGDSLTVAVFVKDAWGNPVKNANGSLSVVDESVLALVGNPKKNPFAFFYEMKRYLGVDTFLSLANLVEKLEVKASDLANGAKGGAGEDRKGGDTKKKRGVFKDTASWTADFVTDANGKFVTKIDALPDNLTTWAVEAVVTVPGDNRIGVGQTSVTTAKEVMIADNLPRIFRSGDSATLSPVVYNRTGKDAEFTVRAAAEGLELAKTSTKITIRNGESAAASFSAVPGSVPAGEDRSMAKITFEASSADGKTDLIEKSVPVFRSETWESVATVGSTSAASFDERLNLSGIDPSRSELSVRYAPSLFGNAFDGLAFLLRYPYGCVEQRTSAIFPHVATKRLADAIGAPFDMDARTVPYYGPEGRAERSVRESLTEYASSMRSYRTDTGGFAYWPSGDRTDFAMTAYALAGLSAVRDVGIPVDAALVSDAAAYLKREFASNRRPYCQAPRAPSTDYASVPESLTCAYPLRDRLSAVLAVSLAKPDDYEAYKMWKLLEASQFTSGQRVRALSVLSRISKNPKLAPEERASLAKTASGTFDTLLKTSLVLESRGSFLSVSDEDGGRVAATAEFLEASVRLGFDSGTDVQILDGMSRFLSGMKKKDGSYGSTLDTVAVASAFATRAASEAASMTNFVAKGSLNGQPLFDTGIGKSDVTRSFEKRIPLSGVPENSTLNFSKTGNGKLYYDVSLTYPVAAENIQARDEGVFVRTETYDFADFRRIKALKDAEWQAYLSGSVRYDALKYPKDAYSYLDPIAKFRVGQLVLVRCRLITAEDRDRVAFESFVPAGAEIVNTRLATESKAVSRDTFFDYEEFLDDRYFGYSEALPAGDYEGSYVFRATHAGTYSVPPTRAFEFYAPEVFGRNGWRKVDIAAK